MKRMIVAVVLCLILVGNGLSDPPKITPVPKQKPDVVNTIDSGIVNKMLVLAAEPASRWRLEGSNENLELRVFDNGKTGVVVANVAGEYTITVTGPGGELAEYRLKFTNDNAPVPPVPGPVDELKNRLKTAFDAEVGTAADKKEQAKDLAELYKQAAALTLKAEVKTSGDLLKRCQLAANVLIGSDKMVAVRKVVSSQLSVLLPTDAPLMDTQRESVAALFTKLSVIFAEFGGK